MNKIMCGIAGSFCAPAAEQVQRMVARLQHRGPDGQGVLDTSTATLGHTRLAILDVAGGHQPMQANVHAISFNGEIYNHLDLRRRYLAEETFATRTDTEVILRLYARLGPACIEWLEGMFALAIVAGGELFLARDPLSIKPLYLGTQGNVLHFASEIKALAQVTDDIREFPPGYWYHSRLGWQRYYSVQDTLTPPCANEDEALPLIRDVLRQAVHRRLMSDVPLGVSLSGGLDSSIVSLLAREGLEHLDTFAVGVLGSPDLHAARIVSRLLGTQHHEFVYDERDMLQALPDVIYYLESFDPALVRSTLPNYFLARLAARYVKVFLTGEGADELYAGYAYLDNLAQPETLQAELIHITQALHNTNLQRADRMSMAHGLEARVPFLDVHSVALALGLPALWKLREGGRPEKDLLRRAFADALPDEIINRRKLKFSQGAGSSDTIARLAEDSLGDAEFEAERQRLQRDWHYGLPNKEALYYYRILRQFYRDDWIFPSLGHSRSL